MNAPVNLNLLVNGQEETLTTKDDSNTGELGLTGELRVDTSMLNVIAPLKIETSTYDESAPGQSLSITDIVNVAS